MRLARHILNRLLVLYVVSSETGRQYSLLEAVCKKGTILIGSQEGNVCVESLEGKKSKRPVVLVLSGRGIVSKEYPAGSDAANRITGHPEEFLFASEASDNGGRRLIFLRREQYEEIIRELFPYKLTLIGVRIDPSGEMQTEALAAGKEFFGETLSGKSLLKASPENNTLFSLITAKLVLPVSGIAMLFLLANFFVQRNLRQQAEEQQFLLGKLRQNAAVREKEQGQWRRLEGMLLPQARHPYGWIADRIASVIPEGVVLTELAVHPLRKKLQDNKPPEADVDRVVICGESALAAPVTQLTDTLRTLEMNRSVQLLSLTRGRNGKYMFEIDLRL